MTRGCRICFPHHSPHGLLPPYNLAEAQANLLVLTCAQPAEVGWAGQMHSTLADLARYIGAYPGSGLGPPRKSTLGVVLKRHKLSLDRL
jgi:hypothetical protein